MTIRFCKPWLGGCGSFHDMEEDWPEECRAVFHKSSNSLQIIKDIEPYQAVGGDIANGGKPPKIGGRRQHREFLKRNGYIEVGNEPIKPLKADYGPEVTEREVRQVYERLRDRR